MVLSQRRSSDKGIHVKEKLHQDHTPGKPEKARKCLRSGHGEWRPRQGRWLVGRAGVPHVHWPPPRACGGCAAPLHPPKRVRLSLHDSFIVDSCRFIFVTYQKKKKKNVIFWLSCYGNSLVFVLKFFFFFTWMRLFWTHNFLF